MMDYKISFILNTKNKDFPLSDLGHIEDKLKFELGLKNEIHQSNPLVNLDIFAFIKQNTLNVEPTELW